MIVNVEQVMIFLLEKAAISAKKKKKEKKDNKPKLLGIITHP